jgi:6-phosphofructokinase
LGHIVGIREGYEGMLEPERFPDGGLVELQRSTVREISHLGGTILGTTNRGNPFHRVVEQPDGNKVEVDCSNDLIQRFRDKGVARAP